MSHLTLKHWQEIADRSPSDRGLNFERELSRFDSPNCDKRQLLKSLQHLLFAHRRTSKKRVVLMFRNIKRSRFLKADFALKRVGRAAA